jgi:DHA1 family multidrug resistance protein-like MFS transporter
VDRDLERAEVQATRTWSARSSLERQRDFEKAEAERRAERRASRASTSSSSTGSDASTSSARARLSSAATASLARTRTHPIEQHRTETHRLQHSQTVGAHPTKSRVPSTPLPEFGGGKPYPPPLPEREEYVVEYDGKDDPLHPQNWHFRKK